MKGFWLPKKANGFSGCASQSRSLALLDHLCPQLLIVYCRMVLCIRRESRSGSMFPDEVFPLDAVHPPRHHVPAKVRALIDFCREALVQSQRGH